MNNFKTKNDVISSFGLPDDRKQYQDIEEWIYYKGSSSVSTLFPNNPVMITASASRFVKFTFSGDNVTKWQTVGVNYEKT